jgi:choline dehydrogenase-like flavoprotein
MASAAEKPILCLTHANGRSPADGQAPRGGDRDEIGRVWPHRAWVAEAAAMTDEVDYIVIGAGPSGCAVAARLAQHSSAPSVALIEAGPDRAPVVSDIPLGIAALVPLKSRYNYAYRTVPQEMLNGRVGYQPRGRGLGGSSLINAMICIRGQPQDYDGWASLGCSGWGWPDVFPYFRRIEDNARGADEWHGVGGPLKVADLTYRNPAAQAFLDAAVQAGYRLNQDFNGPSQEGVGFYQVFQQNGRRWNAARAYVQSGHERANLRVIADRQARRIIFEDRRAAGVAFAGPGGESLRARREIVLSAGVFGSPQLLMVSGVGPADHLRAMGIDVVADAPEVGENLQDHLDHIENRRSNADGLFGLSLRALRQGVAAAFDYARNGRGLLTSNAAEAGGFLKSRAEVERPDLQLHFCVGFVDDHNRKLHLGAGMSLHVCVLRPKSRGNVRLKSADIAEAPLIDPRFLTQQEDRETLVLGARIVRRIYAAPALRTLVGPPLYPLGESDAEISAYIREHADTIYHPVGTCRMGADAHSVVDPHLKARGVEALRIADASIMPTIVSGNTEAPCAMIGEKAADLILADGMRS